MADKKEEKEKKEISEALEELNQDKTRPDSFWKATGLFILEVGKVIIISLAIIIPIRYYLIQPFYVKGASMEPTFHDYEYLIINEISYRFSEPQRGDIVVLKDPRNGSQFLIKRIIGLPKETIIISDGRIEIKNDQYSNELELDESDYLDPSIYTQGHENLSLNSNEFYVLGDNRNSSLDSRIIGPIKKSNIVGKAWIRAWPFKKFRYFEIPKYNITNVE